MKSEVLYKRNSDGKTINQWQIIAEGDYFYTIEGHKDGKLTTSKPTVCTGKNIGKANETTPEDQAVAEAKAKFQKKIDKGYTEEIKDVDTCKTYFDPMLAKKVVDYKEEISYPTLVSRKIDGLRLVARQDGCWTRNGKKYISVPHISNILKPLFDKHPEWVIDSEIYSTEVPFERIVSLVKKKKPTLEDFLESERLCKIYIFDGVTDDLEANFETRFSEIKKEIKKVIGNDKHLIFVENEIANNYQEIMEAHDRYVAEGFEGVMVRNRNTPYQNKRTNALLKYKVFNDEEFKILDILEGQGGRSNMAGKIVVELPNGTCEAGIKGGEVYYIEIWQNREKIIGKLATVRYQGLTDKGSLRFPVAIKIDPFDR